MLMLDFDLIIKIPLGWTKKPYYYIEYMAEGTGWQKRTLIIRVRRTRNLTGTTWPEYYPVAWSRAVIQTQTKYTQLHLEEAPA